MELALIDQLHHRVCEHCLGSRRTRHHGVRNQRISVGVTDTVCLQLTNLAMIDDRNGHPLGMGLGHDLVYFCVERGTSRYHLCNKRRRKTAHTRERR